MLLVNARLRYILNDGIQGCLSSIQLLWALELQRHSIICFYDRLRFTTMVGDLHYYDTGFPRYSRSRDIWNLRIPKPLFMHNQAKTMFYVNNKTEHNEGCLYYNLIFFGLFQILLNTICLNKKVSGILNNCFLFDLLTK